MGKTAIMILQELGMKEGFLPVYTLLRSQTDFSATGQALNKKDAKQKAAQNMLTLLEDPNDISKTKPLSSSNDIYPDASPSTSGQALLDSTLMYEDLRNYVGSLQRKRQSIMVRKIKSQKKVSPNEETLLDKESDKINNKKGWSDRIIKLKENDSITRSLMINVKSGKKRKKKDQILLEGYRLVKDGTEVGVKPKAILSSDIIYLTLYEDVKLFQIPYKTIQLWSNLKTSPGIIALD
ncbi:RISC-loading complex subunit tarbp2-like [Vespula maculifrons]|uniref:RISC-loading complex subunit tarbp2-like n=1 Tax=Vespula maculifrons TaxID=7453 RepID=A0ABD2CY53_VESMC